MAIKVKGLCCCEVEVTRLRAVCICRQFNCSYISLVSKPLYSWIYSLCSCAAIREEFRGIWVSGMWC